MRPAAALRRLLRAVDAHVTPVAGNTQWRDAVRAAFRAGAGEADAARVRSGLLLAQEYADLLDNVAHHRALLASYNIGLDPDERNKEMVAKTAARVGFSLPQPGAAPPPPRQQRQEQQEQQEQQHHQEQRQPGAAAAAAAAPEQRHAGGAPGGSGAAAAAEQRQDARPGNARGPPGPPSMALPARLARGALQAAPVTGTKAQQQRRSTRGSTGRRQQQRPAKQRDAAGAAPPAAAYRALAAASVAAAAGLTLAPGAFWAALGASNVVQVTETSTQRRPARARRGGGRPRARPAAGAVGALLGAAALLARGYAGPTEPGRVAAAVGGGLKSTLRAGRGLAGAFYALSVWEDLVLGIALVAGPILPTVSDLALSPPTLLAKDMVGVGTLLYGGIVWALLDALDAGALGGPTARALNAACAAVSLGVGAVCVAGQANGIATNDTNQAVVLISCLATASVFAWQAAFAPPAEDA
ncbi:hypothetical protein HT031_000898 [Scenedesmus sp. PABB004]|nr:hypothetical protein HT031_000898 [Scenedesmus sp. PABB004]